MRTNRIIIAAVAAAALLAVRQVWAQTRTAESSGENLSITVTGEARGQPDAMYIEFVSDAVAGNVSDGLRQCKEKADAAAKAFRSLNIPDSQVTRQMYEFSSPPPADSFGMVRPAAVPALTKVLQVLNVKIKLPQKSESEKLAETLARVFEAANRSGVGVRQAPAWGAQYPEASGTPVTYVLEDATPLAKQAIADAFRKADQIKSNLIASGVTAGQLVGVTYVQTGPTETFMPWSRFAPAKAVFDPKSAVSASPQEVAVFYTLTFTYKIESPKKKGGVKLQSQRTEPPGS